MEHVVNARGCLATGLQVANVPADQTEAGSSSGNRAQNVVNVCLVPCRKIVQPHDGLPEPQKSLENTRSDETGDSRDEPYSRMGDKLVS